jgi:5'-3' exoribonuclease 2
MQRIDFSSTNSSNNGSKKRGYDEMERESNDSATYNQQDSINNDEEEDNNPNDTVRLWEDGWRERYYKNKFNVGKDDLQTFRVEVAHHYARGLCWVLQYYYQGVPAWDW